MSPNSRSANSELGQAELLIHDPMMVRLMTVCTVEYVRGIGRYTELIKINPWSECRGEWPVKKMTCDGRKVVNWHYNR